MRMEFVNIGDEINTMDGFVRITERHWEDFYVDEFEWNEDGTEVKIGESLLTRHDLNRRAEEVDGKGHNFWWDDCEE